MEWHKYSGTREREMRETRREMERKRKRFAQGSFVQLSQLQQKEKKKARKVEQVKGEQC